MRTATSKRSRPRKRKKSFRPWLLLFRITAWIIVAGLFWSGYLIWLINGYNGYTMSEASEKADAGIILGAALWNNVPSPALRERLGLALRLYEEGRVDKLILSGGIGGIDSTLSEAEGMRDYLIAKGVPPDKLLLETEASSTYQNLMFSYEIAEREGLTNLVIITHDYHAARAEDIADYVGIAEFEVATIKSKVLNPFFNEAREVLAFTKWKLDWLMLELGFRSPDSLL